MFSLSWILSISHLVGLVLGVGAATLKLTLLLRCRADRSFVPIYMKVIKPITRQIIMGMILLILSGIGWLVYGYPFSVLLGAKLGCVAVILVLGPIIDNLIEPRFARLAPAPGVSPSPEFARIEKQYLAMEIAATLLFYAITLIWVR